MQRSDKGFACPVCDKDVGTTRWFLEHLKSHGLNANWTRKRKQPQNTVIGEFIGSRDQDVEINEEVVHTPPPPLSLSTKTPKASHLTYRQTVLASSDSLTADQATQEDKIMLAKVGRWIPLVYEHEQKQHGVLTSATTASTLLRRKSTTGVWNSPTDDDNTTMAPGMTGDYDHVIQHIKNTR